ncbi:extracellular solute-binding protein [Virgisporangium aurantiacum]
MTPPVAGASTNRRSFLGLIGLSAAAMAGGGVLAGCSESGSGSGSATDTDKLSGVLPKQQNISLDIKPDITSTPPIADGYTTFPSSFKKVITEKPGKSGQKISAMTPAWGPAPPGLGSNAYYDAINSELGIQVDFSIQDGNTYADKLGAMLASRDVPELLCIPGWEVNKLPRFTDAVKSLFEDLTDHLSGDKVSAYPMLATFPTGAWREAVWNERLMSVPNPTDGAYPWVLLARKDLLDAAGQQMPKSGAELYELGKKMTDPNKGVWAFDDIFQMVQMLYKAPGSKEGWGVVDGKVVHKYETPQYKQAAEFMAKLYKDGLIHPDVVASKGADKKTLFASGKIAIVQDGMGGWQPLQAQYQKATPTLNIQPVPNFSATGGDPLIWRADDPISYTFVKKGLSKDRVQELLRVMNWCSAPFGTQEFLLREYGVEGKHWKKGAGGVPAKEDLSFKEIQNQYFFISGRNPVVQPYPETPNYVKDMLGYSNTNVKYLEKDPWDGLKLEFPARFKSNMVPTEDKMTDVVRGRRPLSDIDAIVAEWRTNGGDEARDFLAKALSDAGR